MALPLLYIFHIFHAVPSQGFASSKVSNSYAYSPLTVNTKNKDIDITGNLTLKLKDSRQVSSIAFTLKLNPRLRGHNWVHFAHRL